jgi:soluble cytochrome b562
MRQGPAIAAGINLIVPTPPSFMKLRSVVLLSSILATGLSPSVLAEATIAPATAQEDTTELGRKMSAISKAFKKLRSQAADPAKNEDSLSLVAAIRENATASLSLVPEKTAEVPAAEQERFKAEFASKMKSLLAEVEKLDGAFRAGNNEEAKALLEVLGSAQKEGHKEFRKKKPEKK